MLSIALVVQEFQKGPRLIYRYPDKSSFFFREKFFRFFQVDNTEYLFAETTARSLYNQYISLSDENFAKLFRNPPVNKILDLSVGDLELISFTSQCPPGGEMPPSCEVHVSLVTVILTRISESFLFRRKSLFFSPSTGGSLLPSIFSDSFPQITSPLLRRIVENISVHLLQEEKRDYYLTTEVNKILRILDSRNGEESLLTSENQFLISLNFPDEDSMEVQDLKSLAPTDLTKLFQIHCTSSLASKLRDIFHSIVGGHSVDVHFGGSSKSSHIHLQKFARTECKQFVDSTSSLFLKYRGKSIFSQSVLLLSDLDIVYNVIYCQGGISIHGNDGNKLTSSSRLSNFVEALDPTKSIADICLMLDEPIEELLSMTNYLQSLGLIEIIPVIHKEQVYLLHPDFMKDNSMDNMLRDFELFLKSFEQKGKSLEKAASFQSRKRSTSYNSNTISGSTGKRQHAEKEKQRSRPTVLPLSDEYQIQAKSAASLHEVRIPRCNDNFEVDWGNSRENEHVLLFTRILSLFSGSVTVREITAAAPLVVKDSMIEIILFLLRQRVIYAI